jgi:cephalosporin hydroxylase
MSLLNILNKYKELNDPILGTDKNSTHSYVDIFYENYFLPFKNKKINLCEIGIQTGGSLFLWQQYFINGNIYGIDINSNRLLDKYSNLDRVTYIFQDAYDINILNNLPLFDIIIDDGPHTLESQIKFIELYNIKLNKNGYIIIEDIKSIDCANKIINYSNKFNLNFILYKGNKINKQYDDILLVGKKEL